MYTTLTQNFNEMLKKTNMDAYTLFYNHELMEKVINKTAKMFNLPYLQVERSVDYDNWCFDMMDTFF